LRVKIKIDENIGMRWADLFRAAGHDVTTVPQQGLCSAGDEALIAAAAGEARCLVTLDLDFSNPLMFRPRNYKGIAVLRLPAKVTDHDLTEACQTLIRAMNMDDITGKLWIIQRGRIRVYLPEDSDGEEE
jgi:predicted nuclease of predicted toxin-antitoxin system